MSAAVEPIEFTEAPHADGGAPQRDASPSDPLGDALLFVAAHHGRPLSRESLLAGLPIADGRLSVGLFERAAAKAGFEAEATKRPLSDIPALVLPAILIMRDGSARVLLAIDDLHATIVDPSRGEERRQHALADLGADYLGYALFLKPVVSDARVGIAGNVPKRHWFWSVIVRFWPDYAFVAVAALLINLLALAAPLYIMSVYDRVVPNGAIPSLIALSIGLILAIVFDFVFRTVRSRMIDVTGKKIDVILAAKVFEHVIALKMAQRPGSVGVLANQLRDFDSVRDFFTSGTVITAMDLIFAFIFIAVLFVIAGPLAWIPLVMLPVVLVLGLLLQRPLDRAMRRLQAESAARHGVLVESLTSLEAVRAVGGEGRMQTAWERSVAATARSGEDVHFWASLAMTSANSVQQIVSLLMIFIGVFMILDGQLTVGALVAANMLAGRVLGPIAGIATVITRASQTFMSLQAINKIMSLDRERPENRSFLARSIEQGQVKFEAVTFKYPNAPDHALQNINFSIGRGERVGIIGRVGSGKTTVGRLLAGFYEPENGHVLLDGVDIRQYDPADVRAGVGFVLQDTELFFGRLRDNIALGKPNASDAEVLAAARLAGVESFIAGHPLGYEMPIAEGGKSLSGGQKQAIGLARALIRKPRVLFLDEPTAHFDVRSEAEFLERLREIAADNMTIIVSTHRLSVLKAVDRLLLFEKGRLIADGPRDKVLALLQSNTSPAPIVGSKPHAV